MNAAATLSLVSVLAALFVTLLSRRVALAPGSREQRWFAVVVFGSAGYALCDLATTLPASPRVVFLVAGLGLSAVAVVAWGWLRFSQEFASASPGRLERVVGASLVVAVPALVLPVPGLTFTGEVIERPFPPLGVVYRMARSAPLGDAVMAALLVVSGAVLFRLVRAWRRGVPHAGRISLAYAVMLALAANDALAVAFGVPLPVLLDFGWVAPVLAIGWMNTCRLVGTAQALEKLRGELVGQVDARTRALSSTLDSLHQAEKLAALGRFASGVAHEVNNPAAAVTSALELLGESRAVPAGTEQAEALADARSAMQRISSLVHKLLDASMVALPRPGIGVADLAAAVSSVADAQPDAVRGALALELAGAAAARVRVSRETLELVLGTLVRNAADATAPGAATPIEIRAERRDGHVRITVTDGGVGMTSEVLRQAFDPFFTTKPQGRGTGLGLAVARGLVQASGGTLTLQSTPGVGTRAILHLLEAPPADPGAAA